MQFCMINHELMEKSIVQKQAKCSAYALGPQWQQARLGYLFICMYSSYEFEKIDKIHHNFLFKYRGSDISTILAIQEDLFDLIPLLIEHANSQSYVWNKGSRVKG